MGAVIHRLSDRVADRIAAGEVVQRPASVVKELLENAVDAGAGRIELLVKNAGKSLVQVTDDGSGMPDEDARLAFERHATSKISDPEDLFAIRTKGFRGEALASIAAVAHVDLKSRPQEEKLGSKLRIEGGDTVEHEAASCPAGTTIQVKNLFYNVPARRNFLKSNAVELKHIIEEFQRIALTHPNIRMLMYNEGKPVHELPPGKTRQRIVNLFGKKYDKRLVPVEESTDIVELKGFVCKPEFARKKRGEQYLFVNERFVRHYYLDKAVAAAFEELIPQDEHPSYFLYLEIDPSRIDINIHPTKTEIKFDDERAVHAIVHAAVKRALGHFNIAPSLDFDQETAFKTPSPQKGEGPVEPPPIHVDPEYNPFETERNGGNDPRAHQKKERVRGWEELYKSFSPGNAPSQNELQQVEGPEERILSSSDQDKEEGHSPSPYQIHEQYILTPIRSGFILIDQQKAHERILYEGFLKRLEDGKGQCQQLLFPRTVEMEPGDQELLKSMMELLERTGFDLGEFGEHTIVVNGMPADALEQEPEDLFSHLLEACREGDPTDDSGRRERVALALAKSAASRPGQRLEAEEMRDLIDRLFACELPYYSPDRKPTIVTFTLDELAKRFG